MLATCRFKLKHNALRSKHNSPAKVDQFRNQAKLNEMNRSIAKLSNQCIRGSAVLHAMNHRSRGMFVWSRINRFIRRSIAIHANCKSYRLPAGHAAIVKHQSPICGAADSVLVNTYQPTAAMCQMKIVASLVCTILRMIFSNFPSITWKRTGLAGTVNYNASIWPSGPEPTATRNDVPVLHPLDNGD